MSTGKGKQTSYRPSFVLFPTAHFPIQPLLTSQTSMVPPPLPRSISPFPSESPTPPLLCMGHGVPPPTDASPLDPEKPELADPGSRHRRQPNPIPRQTLVGVKSLHDLTHCRTRWDISVIAYRRSNGKLLRIDLTSSLKLTFILFGYSSSSQEQPDCLNQNVLGYG